MMEKISVVKAINKAKSVATTWPTTTCIDPINSGLSLSAANDNLKSNENGPKANIFFH